MFKITTGLVVSIVKFTHRLLAYQNTFFLEHGVFYVLFSQPIYIIEHIYRTYFSCFTMTKFKDMHDV